MITCDTTKLIEDLKKFHLDAVRRLEQMVSGFAYEFVFRLGTNTPVGDEATIASKKGSYYESYVRRNDKWGIPIEAGYHAGSWQFSPSGSLQFTTPIFSTEDSAQAAFNEAQARYKLGSTFYIGAKTPGMEALEFGSSPQAPDGIGDISISEVMSIYSIDAIKYYKQ